MKKTQSISDLAKELAAVETKKEVMKGDTSHVKGEAKTGLEEVLAYAKPKKGEEVHVLPKSGIASDIIAEQEAEHEVTDATRKYLEAKVADFEATVSGLTNNIQLMIDGVIPASFRDLAEFYKDSKMLIAQLNAVAKKAKDFVVKDPTAPSLFTVGSTEFEYVTRIDNRMDTAAWKRNDPGQYAMVKAIYNKRVEVNTLKCTAKKRVGKR